MSDREARRLLAEVSRTAAALDAAKVRRNQAIIAAAAAGVTHEDIASAAGISRGRIGQITRESLT